MGKSLPECRGLGVVSLRKFQYLSGVPLGLVLRLISPLVKQLPLARCHKGDCLLLRSPSAAYRVFPDWHSGSFYPKNLVLGSQKSGKGSLMIHVISL